jgi:hypothetical protein
MLGRMNVAQHAATLQGVRQYRSNKETRRRDRIHRVRRGDAPRVESIVHQNRPPRRTR